MLNKLERFIRQHQLICPNERVIVALSGGADSMALLMGLYLLREKLSFTLEAAHFNHGLRGAESDGDEAFVREFCSGLDIPLHCGSGNVVPGKKGLEAAAREVRYRYLTSLGGKVATAHTADDNAETVLMHMLRGTGLKGLGAIAPARDNIIRPMLSITRQQLLGFLNEYHVSYRTDSSNLGDDFLRNRLRHHVVPLLEQENPRFAENLSAMALRLRLDEEALQEFAVMEQPLSVSDLAQRPAAIRYRILERFLKESGVPEPEAEHLQLADSLVFSGKPSAKVTLPGGVLLYRQYDRLLCGRFREAPGEVSLACPGTARFGDYQITCTPATEVRNTGDCFTVFLQGDLRIRSRCSGDQIRLSGGTKSLKKLYIDRKIPAHLRPFIPVLTDEKGVVGVYGIGADLDHITHQLPAWQISITNKKRLPEEKDNAK
jgi:tRNA(Ile)-lysidine synthase